jgi:hypothetical protein
MIKLSDLQIVLLTTAAGRADGSLLPPACTVAAKTGRIRQTITALVKRGLAADMIVMGEEMAYRSDSSGHHGAAITEAGRVAVGAAAPGTPEAVEPEIVPASTLDAPPTKREQVLALLRRDGGASLAELAGATGWLPHTTRAALTGLRQQGHGIVRSGEIGATRYHLAA